MGACVCQKAKMCVRVLREREREKGEQSEKEKRKQKEKQCEGNVSCHVSLDIKEKERGGEMRKKER